MQGLRDLGYVEGQNLAIEHRSSEGKYERLPGLAAELVGAEVDVIVVPASQNALAARQVTRTVPIVMAASIDPVKEGLIASLGRPGGNVTGLTGFVGSEIGGKRLGLLKEALPKLSRVAVLSNPGYPYRFLEELEADARMLKLQLHMLEAREPEEVERAFATMTKQRPDALYDVRAGGLMSYGPSGRENFHRAARYVDRILNGANPGDLPVERPVRFDLIVNVKTAKALGLALPPAVLGRADEVFE
jgi:putative ABC transport system substrate-binding protein